MKKILFVDLDSTLFNTKFFCETIWQILSKYYSLDPIKESQSLKNYYSYTGQLGFYDIKRHITEVTGLNPEPIIGLLKQELKNKEYLFSDASEIDSWKSADLEIRILTYGEEWFQKLKLDLSPSLKDFAFDIILQPKNQFIQANYSGYQGWLIDDKPDQNLPTGFTEINIDRTQTFPLNKKYDIITINSLTKVKELL